MRAHHRLAIAAFCTDLALYLLMLSLPYRVLEHGASSIVLGLVPLLYAGPYSVVALLAGRFSDRWPRRGPIRVGLTIAIAGAVALATLEPLELVLASVPLIGIGLGFFWPSIQAAFSEQGEGRELERMTQWLNVSWSTGKGLGLVIGGLLLSRIGADGVSALAAAAFLISVLVVPPLARPGDHSDAIEDDSLHPGALRQRAFLRSAWIANGVAFGVVATLNHHLPKVLATRGVDASHFGLFLGAVFLAQTALFMVIGPRRNWQYRIAPLAGVQVMVAIAITLVTASANFGGLMMWAPLFGLGLGFVYQSSLYYSLHTPSGRGRQAGVHEAALGVFSASIPVLGGLAVSRFGTDAPFFVAGIAVVTSLALALTWISRSSPAKT